MLKLISHRGNISGPNPEKENHPEYILAALQEGYDVEIDVWFENEKFMLGHDEPQYEFPFELLDQNYSKLWIHCKNMDALSILNNLDSSGDKVNYFWHENDLGVLTSKGYIWSTNLFNRGILVMPEVFNKEPIETTFGVCSDYIEKYK
jgi:hypothetical protein